ncbi:hypothetical protein CNMCM6805_000361 [Aspergillus fumigatiaffinis]|jgi:hypothetical protein|uniref:2EXR domain-containing protein n=1 Tax=Aspergillus fumigatiaffinis TaxID=340414 RepID=A0A8H4GFU4_9EURO|nr:hypothetical protein CNMCM5878_000589 [Aspergillus fumigatiaffinis]KAF4218467.1 hypothetical protein CNMCM6457_003844 [Aspergillus fumigatiaffinis]KAF4231043.1 hypothetical protein CNMCM6805_000361 [Aspergillus fumigatiaffinis]
MAAFHLFPRLPFELRARIWQLTVEPRTVEVRVKKDDGLRGKILHVTSSTPVPAVLQVCHEARNQGLYQQAFKFPSGVEPRYVWVNFEIDMISIGDTYFDTIEPAEQQLIRRLTIQRENTDSFFRSESLELQMYSNLEEMHVICEDGLLAWQDAWEYVYWPCPKENLRFIDKETGQIAVGEDLDRMADEWLASLPDPE